MKLRKAKTNKASKKRFKITAAGKLLRRKKGRSHIMTKKSSRRKRRLEAPALVLDGLRSTYTKLIIGL